MSFKRLATLVLKNGLLAFALLVTGTLSALATMRVVLSSQEVVVPSLLGKRMPEAGAIAARHGLSLRLEGKRNDARVPADHVLVQEPVPGAMLKAHRSIRVFVSLGPRRITVPAVEGESLRTARITLEQAQVPIGRVVEVDDRAEEGKILIQHPSPGEAEALGEGVSLLVSRGATRVDYLMPDLIGRKAEEVLETLRRAGLKVVDVRYRTYPGVAPGIVLRQMPAAGHRASGRTSVSLDISKALP